MGASLRHLRAAAAAGPFTCCTLDAGRCWAPDTGHARGGETVAPGRASTARSSRYALRLRAGGWGAPRVASLPVAALCGSTRRVVRSVADARPMAVRTDEVRVPPRREHVQALQVRRAPMHRRGQKAPECAKVSVCCSACLSFSLRFFWLRGLAWLASASPRADFYSCCCTGVLGSLAALVPLDLSPCFGTAINAGRLAARSFFPSAWV